MTFEHFCFRAVQVGVYRFSNIIGSGRSGQVSCGRGFREGMEMKFRVKTPCHDREFVRHPNPIGGWSQFMWMCPYCWQPFHELIIRCLESKEKNHDHQTTRPNEGEEMNSESKVRGLATKYSNDHLRPGTSSGSPEDLIRYRAFRSGYIAAMEEVAECVRSWGTLQKMQRKLVGGDQKEADREHSNQMSQLGVILSWSRQQAEHDSKEIWEELKTWNPR